jgi:hypothetical protein
MTREEIRQEAEERVNICTPYHTGSFIQGYIAGVEPREKRIEELEQQIEKLIDFVLSKTECCDVCPITDTCINSEGTCPYAGILAKGEEEVTREWLMQLISRR